LLIDGRQAVGDIDQAFDTSMRLRSLFFAAVAPTLCQLFFDPTVALANSIGVELGRFVWGQ
jgi:hypothetical protein